MQAKWKRLIATACMLAAPAALSAEAHVHGAAALEIAVDGKVLVVNLESPLDSLVGFERAPRSGAERERVRRASERLRDAAAMFRPTPEAGCVAEKVALFSPVIEPGLLGETGKPAAAGHGEDGHAELSGEWRFACARHESLKGMEVRLFDAFPGIRRLTAQVAGPRGQSGATLTPKARLLTW